MQNNNDWVLQYFHADVQQKVQARTRQWTPELQEELGQKWSALFRDIESALNVGENPGSPRSQALVQRWEQLLLEIIGSDGDLVHGVKALYADRSNWPQHVQTKLQPYLDDRMWTFFRSGVAARASTQST